MKLKLVLFLTTIIIASSLYQRVSKSPPVPSSVESLPAENSKLQICPDKWYKNEQPCVYRDSPAECDKQQREYFVIDGKRKEVEEMDVDWIIKNCEVNKPELIY